MARQTLYAYVDGSDLHEVAAEIEALLDEYVAQANWVLARPKLVNQIHELDESYRPGDLPDWDLGLNLDLPPPGSEPLGWFQDIEQIARLVGQVATHTGREFIIGVGDSDTGVTEDLFYVQDNELDLEGLRLTFGIGPRA
jgi:hypothetical protein